MGLMFFAMLYHSAVQPQHSNPVVFVTADKLVAVGYLRLDDVFGRYRTAAECSQWLAAVERLSFAVSTHWHYLSHSSARVEQLLAVEDRIGR